jgi:Rrf2 family protein
LAHISAGVEYGLHSLLYLFPPTDGAAPTASARDLAQLQGLPVEFMAKLLTRLEKAGLVTASEGAKGGFRLARGADAISVLDVVIAIDGDKPLFDCREIRGRCALFDGAPPAWASRGVCSIHAVMLEAEQRLREVLGERTLGAIAARVAAKAPPAFGASVAAWLEDRVAGRRTARNHP